MHLGKFEREIEYLDPGLPVEQELVEPKPEPLTEYVREYGELPAEAVL